jgi:glycosyltransferase involved in cell wall biosynthesis
MIVKENCSDRLLPVAIMAHNEEKVIQKAVESILNQSVPTGYFIRVVIVANGCNDGTEEIVRWFEKQNPNKVVLVSIGEKGKTKAINRAINFIDRISSADSPTPYVIFLDADCEFHGKEALLNFIKRFEQNPQLRAVGADCVPDVFFNGRKDITAEIYRAVYRFNKSLKINSISGMCYGIRLDILKKIDFPEFQFAEDMYVSSRLDGWFYKDRDIQIVFKTPSDLQNEIKRRTRQEISTQRYHRYYSYLKKKGVKVSLFEKVLSEEYRWGRSNSDNIIRLWLALKDNGTKIFVLPYILIQLWAKINAYKTLKKMKKHENLDYWKVLR